MRLSTVVALMLSAGWGAAAAQPVGQWDVTQPRGTPRVIDFTVTEGTWMSVDPSRRAR